MDYWATKNADESETLPQSAANVYIPGFTFTVILGKTREAVWIEECYCFFGTDAFDTRSIFANINITEMITQQWLLQLCVFSLFRFVKLDFLTQQYLRSALWEEPVSTIDPEQVCKDSHCETCETVMFENTEHEYVYIVANTISWCSHRCTRN